MRDILGSLFISLLLNSKIYLQLSLNLLHARKKKQKILFFGPFLHGKVYYTKNKAPHVMAPLINVKHQINF